MNKQYMDSKDYWTDSRQIATQMGKQYTNSKLDKQTVEMDGRIVQVYGY